LERVSAFAAQLDDPQRAYPVFHVAGTNGKGSTVTTLETVLRHAGYRVGRYMSPHLVDFRERIVVDGDPMPPAEIVAWLDRYAATVDALGATFFEVTTLMAFDWFARAQVDVAVIEVGLGGRLDATNIVSPVAAGVTVIGFDHQEFLGHTLSAIAAEKGGVFKRGSAAVIGDARAEVAAVLHGCAERAGSTPILTAGREWSVSDVDVAGDGTRFTWQVAGSAPQRLHTALVGSYQAGNAATALGMLHAAGGRWAEALASAPTALPQVRLAGRFQRIGRWIFDVAHNLDGARTIVETLRAAPVPRPLWALVTVLQDKDWREMLHALAPAVDGFVITEAPTAPASRRWDPAEAAAEARATGRPVLLEPDFDAAIAAALANAETVLATGSFHTVGDVMQRLPVNPLAR
jgi:dihydrofolate synthase/folylpolyglutamate synthase